MSEFVAIADAPSWPTPAVPTLPASDINLSLFDTRTQERRRIRDWDGVVRLYVCGITPYDATHLGHAATYLAFDTLVRTLRGTGLDVRFAQNITDVDDPLLERAARDGVDWRALAAEQTALFCSDMTALNVIPPQHYVRVTDAVPAIAEAVEALVAADIGYSVPTDDAAGDDIYFDVAKAQSATDFELAGVSHFDPAQLDAAFTEFGGDLDRPGKRSPLDPLLWRAAREGEPFWPAAVGEGRPGWHLECAVIATEKLGGQLSIQGGGRDLRFPHHEMSWAHASALTGHDFADAYAHAGLVAYQGEKMSKSLGNLVLVSKLTAEGHDPAAVRLAVLAHHYRSDWEWTGADLERAEARLARWCAAAEALTCSEDGAVLAPQLLRQLCDDLDTPHALELVDDWAAGAEQAPGDLDAIDALLGVRLVAPTSP